MGRMQALVEPGVSCIFTAASSFSNCDAKVLQDFHSDDGMITPMNLQDQLSSSNAELYHAAAAAC